MHEVDFLPTECADFKSYVQVPNATCDEISAYAQSLSLDCSAQLSRFNVASPVDTKEDEKEEATPP